MVYINAISFYLPENILSNEEIISDYKKHSLNGSIEYTSELIFKQCGVRERFVSKLNETTRNLGAKASITLFKDWSIDKSKIDYIIFVSDALEYKGPTTACLLQNDLELNTNIGAIDILHGCTGWVYGLQLANAFIKSGQSKNILLITGDVPTKVIHPEDVELRSIFSDGAAATLVSNEPTINGLNFSIEGFIMGTDGKGEKSLWVERSATKEPADIPWLSQYTSIPTGLGGGRLRMDSPKIFLFAIRKVPTLIKEILKKHNLAMEEIDLFILHQANGTMLEFIRKRLKIPEDKFVINIEETGNTVSASIPIAMCRDEKVKSLKQGSKVLVAAFGIGYSWGGTILTKK